MHRNSDRVVYSLIVDISLTSQFHSRILGYVKNIRYTRTDNVNQKFEKKNMFTPYKIYNKWVEGLGDCSVVKALILQA